MIRAGGAAFDAMQLLIAEGRNRASAYLEASVEDIVYSGGRFVVAGTDRSAGLEKLAATQPLAAEKLHRNENVAWPNGCHVCEVEIDPETGQSVLVRYVAVDDVGRAVNPMIVHGQTMGAVAQGLGQALFEHCIYEHGSGQLLSGSLMDYSLPRAGDLPNIETPATPARVWAVIEHARRAKDN